MTADTKQPPVNCAVVFATPERQYMLSLAVPSGTTALGAVRMTSLAAEFPDHDFTSPLLGIFATRVEHDYVVKEGDRVEVYRPLTADPKEVRRQLAAAGLTMGAREEEGGGEP